MSARCSDELATTILPVVILTYYNNIVILGWCAVPETRVVFFQEEDGEVPVLEWLTQLLQSDRKGYANCVARIKLLAASGYELRRPVADYLRSGIYELRAKHRRVQYRILYFFYGQNVTILAHAITKEQAAVPDIDIERAILRKGLFEENAHVHTYVEEEEND
ncbi:MULTISPECIES: type II toxin-antitoxin system RelE/ParE family toxin [Moorena]|uniref:type II toxin-antitoxin system RelE/ParE family toxin n=1 Tax=Moorena TaxID=1155738 RepID=UPI001A95E756|nr:MULTISPECIES: type II toxin-antitoxin system RelE/ParE family toxin [Moorena]